MIQGSDYQGIVREHYRKQAKTFGLSNLSTMPDEIIREREQNAICRYIESIISQNPFALRVLDVGCGNGCLLSVLRDRFANVDLAGIDCSPEMVELSQSRNLANCRVSVQDVRSTELEAQSFDIIVSERCIINCMNVKDQERILHELHRLLCPGGHCILIEGFTDGFDNMNRARVELGLDALEMPFHNLFFDKSWFMKTIIDLFKMRKPLDFFDSTLPEYNFLSSHYFISRVVHSCITKREDLRNTEFVKFFSFMPPIGNYAAVQLFILQKI